VIVPDITNDISNPSDDETAKQPWIVVSTRHYRRILNHTQMTVFVTTPTSSDSEVVGDLLVCAFVAEHCNAIQHHIVTTAKSVRNLYLHALFGMI
jgi:hypothetical protein